MESMIDIRRDAATLDWRMEPLHVSDYASSDSLIQDRFVHSLGNAFLEHGFAFLISDDLDQESIRTYYKVAADLLHRIPEERLRQFEFVKQGIERGYVSSPSGAPKPTHVSLQKTPHHLFAAGLKFTFEHQEGRPIVKISGAGEQICRSLPTVVYDANDSETETIIQYQDRLLKFRCLDSDGHYQVFAPDDKHGWITGLENNIYPAGGEEFAALSRRIYQTQTRIGLTVVRALARFLNDRNDTLLRLVADSAGNNIASHSLRTYQYPGMQREEIAPVDDQALYVRVGEHRDISLLTVLAKASLPGLQVQTRNQNWVSVRAPEGSVIVMAGEILAHMTRGLRSEVGKSMEIHAPLHRVTGDPETICHDRYTSPFFFNPDLRQPILNLHDQIPLTIRGVKLDPGLRLLHAHMRASTQFAHLTFENFVADYDRLGESVQNLLAANQQIQAIFVP